MTLLKYLNDEDYYRQDYTMTLARKVRKEVKEDIKRYGPFYGYDDIEFPDEEDVPASSDDDYEPTSLSQRVRNALYQNKYYEIREKLPYDPVFIVTDEKRLITILKKYAARHPKYSDIHNMDDNILSVSVPRKIAKELVSKYL